MTSQTPEAGAIADLSAKLDVALIAIAILVRQRTHAEQQQYIRQFKDAISQAESVIRDPENPEAAKEVLHGHAQDLLKRIAE